MGHAQASIAGTIGKTRTKKSKRTQVSGPTKEDMEVKTWFALTLLGLAETLMAASAGAPPAVRRRLTPGMVDKELATAVKQVVHGDLTAFVRDVA